VIGDGGADAPPAPEVERLVGLALASAGVEDGHVAVEYVDPARIAELNAAHRGTDGPTDVLSFPIDGVTDAGTSGLAPPMAQTAPDLDDQPLLLGDVVICPAVAHRQAPDHAGSYDDEVALLVVHGLLHLLGHDHAGDDEREVMQARERVLLAAHHGPLAADPWAALAAMGEDATSELAAADPAASRRPAPTEEP